MYARLIGTELEVILSWIIRKRKYVVGVRDVWPIKNKKKRCEECVRQWRCFGFKSHVNCSNKELDLNDESNVLVG